MRDFKENPEKYLNYQKRVDKYNHPKDAGEKETKKIKKSMQESIPQRNIDMG
jgi:hypothetical protein